MDIGSILKQARKNRGLLVKEVIHRLSEKGFKVSEKTLYGWENNYSQPSIEIFLALSEIYGIEKNAPGTEQEQENLHPPKEWRAEDMDADTKKAYVTLWKLVNDLGWIGPDGDITQKQADALISIINLLETVFHPNE